MTFNIQRFSTHDGPGIRTVVFMKGCTLHCRWCENPESQSFGRELFYDEGTCIGCLDCARAAGPGEIEVPADGRVPAYPRFNRTAIRDFRKYDGMCPSGALSLLGEELDIEELVRTVKLDSAFYGEEGGVTFSGGEPFAQPNFIREAVTRLFAEEFDIAVETSLQVPWSAIEPTVPMVSLYLADLKHVDSAKYRSATGGTLSVVLENFRRLEKTDANVTVRIPVIPGFNDTTDEIIQIARFAGSLSNVDEVHLLPYHTFGKGKYECLGREYPMGDTVSPPPEHLEEYARLIREIGLRVMIGG